MEERSSQQRGVKRSPRRAHGPAARLIYMCIGYVSLAAGVVGIFLPLMPTTVFVLIALWSFSRSNPAMVARIEAHPRFGSALADWREGAISSSSKAAAGFALALSFAVCAITLDDARILAALAVVLGCVALFIMTRPSPKRRQGLEAAPEERSS